MVQETELIEIDIDGRTFWVRPVGAWVLDTGNVVATALAESLDKPLEWALDCRVLLRQHRTQHGTLDDDSGNIRI